jgi:hypothetical protein
VRIVLATNVQISDQPTHHDIGESHRLVMKYAATTRRLWALEVAWIWIHREICNAAFTQRVPTLDGAGILKNVETDRATKVVVRF